MSPRRRAVLDAVRDAPAPSGVTEVADRLSVHPNTVRFHLDALVAQGRIERTVEEPSGPGRPRTVYTSRQGMDRGGERRYRLLARILLGQLESTGPDAEAAATAAGRAWGRYLVEQWPPSSRPTAREALERLAEMLTDLGFDPWITDEGGPVGSIRLRHCPFLELAEEYGTIVCPLHLGLIRGALAELSAPLEATRLEPFAEPDACLAHLAASGTAA
ncbi:ArsR family transcriptional regulator [Streptomyces brasiliensis]|uniref:ArsR family transcriptional regulator n=1 Tax=Streptomyces brasiliensis TaxID=1954 RepID=A0A917KU28_9ACTN|nr:ArsR family transcriptional regulator [Streptomyces brasiliensis]